MGSLLTKPRKVARGYPYLTKETWTPPYAKHYGDTSSKYFQMASDILPFLKA